jgi:sugar (pentulose or hexulose) kinase
MHPKEKSESLVIGLDSSTTGTKAFAFNKKGSIVAHANDTIPLFSPKPNYYEQDPNDWCISAQKAFRTMSSCSESGYYYECSLRAGTFAINWFIKNILNFEPSKISDIHKQLENEAQQIPAGSEGLLHLPYLCGAMNPY